MVCRSSGREADFSCQREKISSVNRKRKFAVSLFHAVDLIGGAALIFLQSSGQLVEPPPRYIQITQRLGLLVACNNCFLSLDYRSVMNYRLS